MPDVLFVGEPRGAAEDATGVGAVKSTGFGRRIKDLGVCHGVLFEVINRFVSLHRAAAVGVQSVDRNHGVNGPGIREGEVFSLQVGV